MNVTHIGKIEHLDIYYDPLQEKDQLVFGRKSDDNIKEDFIWVPYTSAELWEKAQQYQKDHKGDIVVQPERTLKDYDFVIGNSMDLKIYEKALKLMKK